MRGNIHTQHHTNSTRSEVRFTQPISTDHSPPNYAAQRSKSQCPRHNYIQQLSQSNSTFQPQIKQIPYQLYPKQWQNLLKSKKQQWQQLTRDNRQRDLIRAQLKIKSEMSQMQQLTFQPNPNRNLHQQSQQVFDRLFDESQTRKIKQTQLQKQTHEIQLQKIKQMQQIGKNQSINTLLNRQKFDLTPLYLRLQQVMKKQIQHRKMIAQKQKKHSFQPTINNKSNTIVSKQQRIKNIVDKLIQDYKIKQHKINQLRNKLKQQTDHTLTFKPNINNFIPPQLPPKQSIHSNSHQQPYSYHPTINQKSILITKQERQEQTQQQMINRLHSAPILKFTQKMSLIQSEMYAQCSFNPQINQLSKQIHTSTNKTHHCATPVKEQPTYKPQINQVSKTMTAKKRARSIDSFKQKTKTKAQSYIKQTQYDQLKQCTFKPKILSFSQSKNSSKLTSIHNISGFQNFKKNKQKAQQQQKSRQLLHQKLFNLQKSYDKRMQKKTRCQSLNSKQNIIC